MEKIIEKRIYNVRATLNRWENTFFHDELIKAGLKYVTAFNSWPEMEEHIKLATRTFVISFNDNSFVRMTSLLEKTISQEEFLKIISIHNASKKFGL